MYNLNYPETPQNLNMIDYPLNHLNPNSLQLSRKILESRNNPYNYFSQSKTEIVDISREKKLINFDEGNKDILFVSTLGMN